MTEVNMVGAINLALARALSDHPDVIVMGVPSHGFRGVLTELAKELRPWVPVVSLSKGRERDTLKRMTEIIGDEKAYLRCERP